MNGNVYEYFKIRLRVGQTLRIEFRTPDAGGGTGASIYDANGALMKSDYTGNRSELRTVEWSPSVDGIIYLNIGTFVGKVTNAVYLISVQ